MGLITRLYNFANGAVADAEQVDAELDQILTLVNGNIENVNIKATAAISGTKLKVDTAADALVAPFVTAPPKLKTGFQETGYYTILFSATAGAQFGASTVNFKTVMTNIPSSITVTPAVGFPINMGAVSADLITIYGCRIYRSSSAAGTAADQGTYTTVGN